MTRNNFIHAVAEHEMRPEVYAKRQGCIVFVDLFGEDGESALHFDAYIDDRCYCVGATALQPAESGYAVDAIEIRWAAFNDKTFHFTAEQKKGLEKWLGEWLAEDWAEGGSIARQATQLSMWGFMESERAQAAKRIINS